MSMTCLEPSLPLGNKFPSPISSSYHKGSETFFPSIQKNQNKLNIINSNQEKNLTRRLSPRKATELLKTPSGEMAVQEDSQNEGIILNWEITMSLLGLGFN